MLVEFPFFAAGINYFPGEISALRVFEPRYLLLIGDSIVNSKSFLVGRNMEELGQVVSEVEILEHQDISNAEQLVVIECKNLYKVKEIITENEYPICKINDHNDVGLPPGVNELDNLEKNIKKIRKSVGLVFQDPDDQLFMPTVLEDVMFGPRNFGYSFDEAKSLSLQALEQVKMLDFIDKAPHHLSFGQKRKVAIASVLASEPELLVLDEPSSNLDPASRRELIDILKNLDVSIILVTHDLPMALEICNRSIILNNGKITADDDTYKILKNEKIMSDNRLELPFGFALHHLEE